MKNFGTDEIAKYPFITDGREYLKSIEMDLEKIGTDPEFKSIVDKAYHRIVDSLDPKGSGKPYQSNITIDTATETVLQFEIISFVIAIILLKLSKMNTLIQRFSLNEAILAEKYLEQDLKKFSKNLNDELAPKILSALFSVNVTRDQSDFVISVSDYLTHAINFHEREWKLVNRRVENGQVFLTPHEAIRLVRKELSKFINSQIHSSNTPPMYPAFEKPVQQLIDFAKKHFPIIPTFTSTEYPPCIKHAIDVLERGENLPHSGRFMLATYLLSKGQTVDQIAPLFKNAPDYNEKITLYQLNHLAGESGSGTKYSCPSCEKLKSQNLCFAIPECDNIINPLQFGKKRLATS